MAWRTISSAASQRAAGLDDQFTIVDERESNAILADAVEAWARRYPEAPDAYLAPEYVEKGHYRTQKWAEILTETARNFIKQAKDNLLSPSEVGSMLERLPGRPAAGGDLRRNLPRL